jgi:hypothetical protein
MLDTKAFLIAVCICHCSVVDTVDSATVEVNVNITVTRYMTGLVGAEVGLEDGAAVGVVSVATTVRTVMG